MSLGLTGKYCLITGATRGLGNTLARAFWEAGANLILVARSADALGRVIRDLGSRPDQEAISAAIDLAAPDAAIQIAHINCARVPHLNVLINNAAIQGPIGPLWENDWSAWLSALQVNLLSPIALCKAFAPRMIEGGGGSIINISGGGATSPRANFTAYATAKTGLVRFSETLAEELRPHDVRVNCIAPGAMNTTMLAEVVSRGADAAGPKEYAQAVKVQQEGGASMQRVAGLCMFLASDAARDITGKLISAVWDPWGSFPEHLDELNKTDIYTLRRIVPKDRGKTWGNDQ
ncbi:MAG: SDR family oxidoreductase [Burkholderiales bacterium]|nr:SDR family oxidoreductase [Burkholderiales bacterium]MBY0577374.1 SDR family oxidoreductase [Gallionellaceae bacterium]